MEKHKIFAMPFSKVYPLYINKVEKKGRTKSDVDEVIMWLTGYTKKGLQRQIDKNNSIELFFKEAPKINPKAKLITGVICGYRVEEITDKLMRNIRRLDKLIDELAKGKEMDSILREK